MAKIEVLRDSFDNNTVDSGIWPVQSVTGTGHSISAANQRLVFTFGGNFGTIAFADKVGTGVYDLTDSYLIFELVNPGDQTINSLETYIHLSLDDDDLSFNNYFGFGLNLGFLATGGGVGGVLQSQISSNKPYDLAEKWFRFSEKGGQIFLDVSKDRTVWRNLKTFLTSSIFSVTTLKFLFRAQKDFDPSTQIIIDNINIGGNPAKLNPLVFRVSPRKIYTGTRDTPRLQGNAFSELAKNSNNGFQENNYTKVYNLGFFGEDPAHFPANKLMHSQPVRELDEVVSY